MVSGRFTLKGFIDLKYLSEARYILGVTFVSLVVIYLSRGVKLYKSNTVSILFLVSALSFIYILILSSLYSPNKVLAIDKLVDLIFLIILIVGAYFVFKLYPDYKQIFKVTGFTFLVIGLIYMIPILISILSGAERGTIYIGGPNVVTRILFFALVSSGYLYSLKKQVRYIWFSTLFFIGIVLIGSRGGMVGAFTSLSLFLLIYILSSRFSLKVIFNKRIVSILVITTPLIIGLSEYFMEVFRERFILLLIDKIYYSSRDIIYENSLSVITESPIIGYGLNAYSSVVGGTFFYPHNIILEILIDSGLIGLIPLLIILLFSVICIFKYTNRSMPFFIILPIYMILVSLLSGDLYDFRYYFFWVFLILIPLGRYENRYKFE